MYRQNAPAGGVEMRRIDTEMKAVLEISSEDARAKATRLLLSLDDKKDRDALIDLLCTMRRSEQKRRSDRITDPDRRVLIGARLPRWLADQYKEQARISKRSMYAWASEAFMEKYRRERDG